MAENLHTPVYELKKNMPASEYVGWMMFYKERARKEDAKNGNLLAMDPDDMVKAMTK